MKTSESKTLPPKNLIFMNRGERTEYQPTLSHNLDPTRSLGRSKLTNYEFLIDQNRDKQTECPPDRNPRIANKETNKRVSHSVELFSQETSKQQKRPSTDMPSNLYFENYRKSAYHLGLKVWKVFQNEFLGYGRESENYFKVKVFSDSRPKSAQKLILKYFSEFQTQIICRLSKIFKIKIWWYISSTLTVIVFLHYRVAAKMAPEILGYMCRARL